MEGGGVPVDGQIHRGLGPHVLGTRDAATVTHFGPGTFCGPATEPSVRPDALEGERVPRPHRLVAMVTRRGLINKYLFQKNYCYTFIC